MYKWSVYQDRLGINMGTVEINEAFLWQAASPTDGSVTITLKDVSASGI
jgi:hypothetical protein